MIILLESIYSLNSCQGRAAFLLCSDLRCTKLRFGQIVSIDNLITLLFLLYNFRWKCLQCTQRTHTYLDISDCKSESNKAWNIVKTIYFLHVSMHYIVSIHSMAIANLNKSKRVLTNTTAASKYIPRRTRISINWNLPFQTFFMM